MKSKIDYKEIIKLIDLIEERNLSHFELEVEGFKINLSKSSPSIVHSEPQTISVKVPEAKQNEAQESAEHAEKTKNNFHYITSPMVGTFYRAPDPSSPVFVEIGDEVNKNQTLCIIEAMKLMNEIESDVDGVLEEILVENGKPVEYGQKLFSIKSSE